MYYLACLGTFPHGVQKTLRPFRMLAEITTEIERTDMNLS